MAHTILIVDDSQLVRSMVGAALTAAGYAVIVAGDGAEGLERLRANPPALVICDVNMPRMSGLELLEAAREVPGPPPFVMLTTDSDPVTIAAAKAAGAKAWILKPSKAPPVIAAVRKVLGE
jgi:two-component system, chemotaxis family, chemotaxis protein CheY